MATTTLDVIPDSSHAGESAPEQGFFSRMFNKMIEARAVEACRQIARLDPDYALMLKMTEAERVAMICGRRDRARTVPIDSSEQ